MLRTIAAVLTYILLQVQPAFAQTVRIAHPPIEPFAFVKDGQTQGLVVDILRAAAKREHLAIAFVPISYAQVRNALANGTADAIAPFPISARALPNYDVSGVILTTGGALFVRAPDRTPPGLAALAGKTVVTPSFGPFVTFIHRNFPQVRVIQAASYPDSLNRVLTGQAAAAALNIQEGASAVAKSYAGRITIPSTVFEQIQLGLAVAKGKHSDFLRKLNAGLAALRADGTLKCFTCPSRLRRRR